MQETRTCHAAFLNDLTDQYLKFHRAKEGAFWETRMGLADRHDTLSKADVQLQEFLSDADTLAELRRRREAEGLSVDQETILDGWILMFSRNQVENPDARVLRKESVEFENALQRARGEMKLGYTDPRSGEFVPASSVALANGLRSGKDAAFRKACFEGLRSIETFVLDQDYCRVVRDRNRFARMLGFEDYYDYKVLWAEGFDKKTLFGYLDDLEERTREKAAHERKALASREGEDALEPWNFPYHTWGSIQTERDAYFRFEDSIDRWARSFAALGIRYRDARITLDLVDRKGKYENGFMHGPSPAFFRGEDWQPAEINFTANALPDKPGSGFRALQTLFHEGGHAAHFSNILMGAPCFSQEYAPTSVAFAETQSMFLDSILEDADWQVRYALDESGRPMSADLVEKGVRITHPFLAQNIRNMLVVCYAEKELYEMAEEDLTPENVLSMLRDVERRLVGLPGGCPRPTLAVPHLLSAEASCYYHGYVLAQMAVYQTRDYFLQRYGHIVDNPAVGEELARVYWAPGNSRGFLELVEELTGGRFSADALVAHASLSTDEAVRIQRERMDRVAAPDAPAEEVDLGLRLRVIHGKETIVEEGGSVQEAAARFRDWIFKNWPRDGASITG